MCCLIKYNWFINSNALKIYEYSLQNSTIISLAKFKGSSINFFLTSTTRRYKFRSSSRFSYHCIHTCACVWSPSFAKVSNHKFIYDKFIKFSKKNNNIGNNDSKTDHKTFCSYILLDLLIILNEK